MVLLVVCICCSDACWETDGICIDGDQYMRRLDDSSGTKGKQWNFKFICNSVVEADCILSSFSGANAITGWGRSGKSISTRGYSALLALWIYDMTPVIV